MKQLLQSYKSGELWLSEVPVPSLKSKGIIIRNQCSFVSAGTEKMLVDFAQKNLVGKALAMPDQVKKVLRKIKSEGLFTTLEKVKTKLEQPIPMGYSCAGIIEEIGHDMNGIRVGERVACGGAGYANHAEFNFVPKNLIVRIPDNVCIEDASSATVGSIALQGVRQCNAMLGEKVCVIGLGLLGLFAVQLLKSSGIQVLGFDLDKKRCKLAEELGADCVVTENLSMAAEEFSQGQGVDATLITAATKSDEPVTIAGEITRMKGKVIVTGMVGMNLPRDMYYKKELDFKLSMSYGPGRYDSNYEEGGQDYPFAYVRWTEQRNISAFLNLVSQGKITPSKLVTHKFKFDNALDAYKLLLGKTQESYLGIILKYDEVNTKKLERFVVHPVNSQTIKKEKVKLGFIGAGNFSKAVLLPTLIKNNNVQFKIVCTATGSNASETAKRYGFEFSTTDINKVLDNNEVDAVFITTRHNTHASFVAKAINAGKHVFVEKPLASSQEGLEEIKQALKKNPNQILTVGFNRRFSPHAKLINKYFSNRQNPMTIQYRINAGSIPKETWIQDRDIGGGRIIGEVCHFIDFVQYITSSDIINLQASSIQSSNHSNSNEDNISVNISFKDGSMANIFYTAEGPPELSKERCEIFADGSVAVLEDFKETKCFGKLGTKKLKGNQSKGFKEELETFIQCIITPGKFPISLQSLILTTESTFTIRDALHYKNTIEIAS